MPIIKVKDIKGKEHRFVVTVDTPESIVDIAEREWVELPYSCRSGACFSCCAFIQKGGKRLDHQKTGEQLIDTEPGEFLCCIGGLRPEAFAAREEVEIELEMMN